MKNVFESYKKMNIQSKAALWFVFCNFLQKGISFITVPVFTRLMTTEQYGTYTLYLSWLQVFTIISSLYLYNGVFDNGMSKFKEDRNRYQSSMLGLTIIIYIVTLIVFMIFYPYIGKVISLQPLLLFFLFIEIAFTPATNFWMGRQRFEYLYKKLVFVILSKSLLNPILGIIAVSNTSAKDISRIFSVVIIEVIFGAILMIQQFCVGKVFFDRKYWRYAIKLALPILPHYLSGMILNQGDRIMINSMVGRSEVALYGVAYSIGMIAQIVINAINSAITPWIYKKMENRELIEIKKSSNFIILLVFLFVSVLMLISPETVSILGSDEYRDAVYVIPPVAASVFFIFLYLLLSFPQFYFEKTNFLMTSSIIAAVINVVLNYIFIKLHGFIAAGYTTLFCYVLYSLGHYITSRRILRKQFKNMDSHVVNYKELITITLILLVETFLMNYIISYPIIRYFLTLLIVYMFVKSRKIIFKFMNKMK